MKKLLYFLLLMGLIMIPFISCSKNDDDNDKPADQQIQASMQGLDADVAVVMQEPAVQALVGMPEGLPIMPDMPVKKKENSFFNGIMFKKYINMLFVSNKKSDDFPTGTWTYSNGHWNYSPQPTNELIINYPFKDFNNQTHQAQIRAYDYTETATAAGVKFQLKVDNVVKANLVISAAGTGMNTANPQVTQVSITGNIGSFNFDIVINNTSIVIHFGPSGNQITIEITGNYFLSTSEVVEPVVTSIKITKGSVSLVLDVTAITNPNATYPLDIGDVLVNNQKEADLILKVLGQQAGIYVKYPNGNEVPLQQYSPIIASLFGSFWDGGVK